MSLIPLPTHLAASVAFSQIPSPAAIRLRFSRGQLQMLVSGLQELFDALSGSYIPVYRRRFLKLLQSSRATRGKSRRLRLDAFDVALCLLAVRITRNIMKRGGVSDVARGSFAFAKFLSSLEKRRKRAKRAWIKMLGAASFSEHSAQWKELVAALRTRLRAKDPQQKRPVAGMRLRKLILYGLVKSAEKGLFELGVELPEAKHLRRLVRLGLRYVRRGRTDFGVLTLYRDDVLAAHYFGAFVAKRLLKRRNNAK